MKQIIYSALPYFVGSSVGASNVFFSPLEAKLVIFFFFPLDLVHFFSSYLLLLTQSAVIPPLAPVMMNTSTPSKVIS